LRHHAREVDGPEVFDKTFCWEQGRILKDVQGVWLLFPAHKFHRLFQCIQTFVQEWNLEHVLVQVELLV
jgi:hypothetical protein